MLDRKSTRLHYTLSLHDALPIYFLGLDVERLHGPYETRDQRSRRRARQALKKPFVDGTDVRSEEHTPALHSFPTRRSSDLFPRARCRTPAWSIRNPRSAEPPPGSAGPEKTVCRRHRC